MSNLNENPQQIPPQNLQKLLSLIPKIKNTQSFGETAGGEKSEDGTISFPFVVPAPVVSEFHKMVYDLDIVFSFDWSEWEEGRRVLEDPDADFSGYDMLSLRKFITVMVRADRFCEGYLESCFSNGVVLKILEAMEREGRRGSG